VSDFRETDVTYKAKANFSELLAQIAAVKAAIDALRATEKDANSGSTQENKDVAASQNAITKSLKERAAAQRTLNDLEKKAKGASTGGTAGQAGGSAVSDLNAVDDAQKKVSNSRRKMVKDTQDLSKAEQDLAAARFRASAAGDTSDLSRMGLEKKIFGQVVQNIAAYNDLEKAQTRADTHHVFGLRDIKFAAEEAGRAESAASDAGTASDSRRAGSIRAITSGLREQGVEAEKTATRVQNLFAKIASLSTGLSGIINRLPPVGPGALVGMGLAALPALYPILSSLLNVVGPLIAGFGALGAGTLAFASNLASLSAGLVAVVPLMAGMATMMGTIKMALAGVTGPKGAMALYARWQDLIALGASPAVIGRAQKAYQNAFQSLAPAAQQFVTWNQSMQNAFDAIQHAVQQNFFAQFVKDLHLVNGLLPPLAKLFMNTATAMGQVVDDILKALSGPRWITAINTFADTIVPLIGVVSKTIISTLGLFRDLTIAALPFTVKMVNGLNNVVAGLVAMLNTPGRAAAFTAFLDVVYSRLLVWLDIVKNIALVMARYSSAASGWSNDVVKNFDKVTKHWADMAKAAEKPNSGFKKYLEEIKPLLAAFGRLGSEAVGWIKRMMFDPQNIKDMTKIADAFGILGHALASLLDTLTKGGDFSVIVDIVAQLIKLIDQILKLGGIQGIQGVWNIIDNLLKFLNGLLAWASKAPVIGNVLGPIVTSLSVLATLSFIGKFTGLTDLFASLMLLAGTPGILAVLDRLPGVVPFMSKTGVKFTDAKNPMQQTKNGEPSVWATKPSKNDPLYKYNKGAKIGDPVMGPGIIDAGAMSTRQAALAYAKRLSAFQGEERAFALASGGKDTASILEKLGGFLGLGAKGGAFRSTTQALMDAGLMAKGGKAWGLGGLLGKGISGVGSKILPGIGALFGGMDLFNMTQNAGSSKGSPEVQRFLKHPTQANALAMAKSINGGVWGGAGQGALDGFGIGSLLGPWGMLGGALVGGVYGGATGGIQASGSKNLGRGWGNIAQQAWKNPGSLSGTLGTAYGMLGQAMGLPKGYGSAFGGVVGGAAGFGLGNAKGLIGNFQHGGDQIAGFFKGAANNFTYGAKQISGFFKGVADNFTYGGKQIVGFFKGVVANFAHGAQQIASFFKPVTDKFAAGAKQIGDWWSKEVIPGWAHGAKQIGDWWSKQVVPAWAHGAKQIGDWWSKEVIPGWAHGAKQIGDWWSKTVVPAWAHGAQQIAAFFKPVVDGWFIVAKQVGQFFKPMVDKWAYGAKQIGDWFHGVINNFAHGWSQIAGWWKGVIDNFAHGWSQIAGWWKGVIDNFAHGWSQITDWFHGVIDNFAHGWKQITDWFQGLINNFAHGWKQITDWFTQVGKNIDNGWHSLTQWWHDIGKHIDGWWNGVTSWWQQVGKNVNKWWDGVTSWWQQVGKNVNKWWDGVTSWWQQVGKNVSKWWDGVTSAWVKIGQNIRGWWDGVSTAWVKIGKDIRGWWDGVTSGFVKIGKDIYNWWNGVTSGFVNIGKKIFALFGGVAGAFMNAIKTIGGIGGAVGGAVSGPLGSVISGALKAAGAPLSWAGDIAKIIHFESGGNANAQNNWDSNAKAGHPSQGLMQLIPGTFSAYAGGYASRGIRDPFANVFAGIRYIMANYGSVYNVPGIKSLAAGGSYVGYSTGGSVTGGAGPRWKKNGTDTVPAMLTPGEFVIRKPVVDLLGVQNLRLLNSMTTYSKFLTGPMRSPRPPVVAPYQPGVPGWMRSPGFSGHGPSPAQTFGNIIINNPLPERASDTLPRTTRKMGYLGPTR
jgi:phage-related protein